jgi:hypothetical protein
MMNARCADRDLAVAPLEKPLAAQMLADRQRFSRWPGAADGAAASAGSGAARVVRSRSAKKINFWCRVIWTGSAWIEPSG